MAVLQNIDHARVVDYVSSSWTRLKDHRKVLEDRWLAAVLCYAGEHPDMAKWVARSQSRGFGTRFIPIPWSVTESLVAQISQSIFDLPDWCKCEPGPIQYGRASHDDALAEQIRDVLKHYWTILGCIEQAELGIRQLIITGNLPFSVTWDREEAVDYPAYLAAAAKYDQSTQADWQLFQQAFMEWQMIAQMSQQQGLPPPPKPQWSTPPPPTVDTMTALEGPRIEIDDIFNFVMDDDATGGRPLRIKRSWKRKAWLEKFAVPNAQGYALYENLDQVTEQDTTSTKSEQDTYLEQRANAFGTRLPPTMGVELLEAQGDMIVPLSGEDGRDALWIAYIATIANRRTCIRWEPTYLWSGKLPTNLAKLFPVPGQVYGQGIGEKITSSADLLNRRANQITDAVDVVVDPEWKVLDDGVYDLKSKTGPGKKHLVGDMDNIQPLVKNVQGIQIGMADLGAIKGEILQISRSANPYQPAGAEETATEVDFNAGLIGADYSQMVQQIERSFIAPAMMLQIDHWAVFAKPETIAPVVQKGVLQWNRITPEAWRKGWLVKIESHKRAMQQREQNQNLFMAIEMFGGNPLFAQFMNPLETMMLVWQQLQLPHAEKVFIVGQNSPEQMAMAMMQAIQQAQMMGQGAGNAGVPAVVPQGAGGGQAGPATATQGPPRDGAGGDQGVPAQ